MTSERAHATQAKESSSGVKAPAREDRSQGPIADSPQTRQARDQFLQSIRDVVTEERPVQSFWTVQSETG